MVKEGPLSISLSTCEHRICPSEERQDSKRRKGAHSNGYSPERRLRELADNRHKESPFLEDLVHKVLFSQFCAVAAFRQTMRKRRRVFRSRESLALHSSSARPSSHLPNVEGEAEGRPLSRRPLIWALGCEHRAPSQAVSLLRSSLRVRPFGSRP